MAKNDQKQETEKDSNRRVDKPYVGESSEKKGYLVIGHRYVKESTIHEFADGKEEVYEGRVEQLANQLSNDSKALIIGHMSREGRGGDLLPARQGESRYDVNEKFKNTLKEFYGKEEALSNEETGDLARNPDKEEARKQLFSSLPTDTKERTLREATEYLDSNFIEMIRYNFDINVSYIDEDTEAAKNEFNKLKDPTDVKDLDKAIERKVKLRKRAKHNEVMKREVRAGNRLSDISQERSRIRLEKEKGDLSSLVEDAETNNDMGGLLESGQEDIARRMLNAPDNHAIVTLDGIHYSIIKDINGEEVVSELRSWNQGLTEHYKNLVNDFLKQVAEWGGYTLEGKEGLRTPTFEQKLRIGYASLDYWKDVRENYISMASEELKNLSFKKFREVYNPQQEANDESSSIDISEKTKQEIIRLKGIRKQAGAYAAGHYTQVSKKSITKIREEEEAKKAEVEEKISMEELEEDFNETEVDDIITGAKENLENK